MAVEEVAMSIAYSGYFEHEPLFVEAGTDGNISSSRETDGSPREAIGRC